MRVTNRMLSTNLLSNLNRNLNIMSKTQNQMSTGKKVSRPSDDPVAVTLIMGNHSTISEQERCMKNMEDGIDWLDATDSALGDITSVIQRVSELAVAGASDTNSTSSKEAIAKEIGQLSDQLFQIANTNYAGRYIFGGTYTNQTPFVKDSGEIEYQGNDESLNWEINTGITIAVNATGQDIFQVDSSTGKSKLFQLLADIKTTLETESGDAGDYLDDIQEQLDNVLEQRAIVGAKGKRLEMAKEQMSEVNLNLTELNSKMEDIDIAEATMNYAMQEAVYKAALMTGTKILQPSLLDYLN
ncbi:flagellar hook-associated protein FlgL [Bacillota bacterium LX-D]|nr:flagellar hook-associated protein FlgL [Bacillota bacterium LX-D]